MKLPDFVDKHYKFDRLSMKTAVFMDKVYKNDNPSTEHSVSVDGFLLYAQHGHVLTGESPQCAPMTGSI